MRGVGDGDEQDTRAGDHEWWGESTQGHESGADGGPGSYIHRTTTASDEHATSPAVLGVNEWHHISATFSVQVLKLYVDGVLMASYTGTSAGPIKTSTLPLFLGGNPLWGEFFAGVLDDVKIYNRALTQAEISTMAAGK